MEQFTDIQTPTKKIYKDRAIWTATLFGGPLAGGYLIAENFKVFNEPDKAKKTWIYAIIATVLIFGGIFLIPNPDKIPEQLIPLIYTAIAYYLVKHFQGTQIDSHIKAGGQVYNWWRAFGIGLLGTIVILLPILGIALLSDTATTVGTANKTYGILKHEIAFDKNNISELEVDKLADGFISTTFFDQSFKKYVYVKKVGVNYEISISVNKTVSTSSDALATITKFRNDMQALFPRHKIIFKLVVDNLDNVVKRLE